MSMKDLEELQRLLLRICKMGISTMVLYTGKPGWPTEVSGPMV
jgi:hypothetical protein